MPSFDVVSRIDIQEVDNAVNNTRKEIDSRFDFRGSKTTIDIDKKANKINILTDSDMRAGEVRRMLIGHLVKRKVDTRSVSFGEPEGVGGSKIRLVGEFKEGLTKDEAQKVVKIIKGLNIKVQPAIQDEQVRVTAKKIDDLQAVITALKSADIDTALQFVNMKS